MAEQSHIRQCNNIKCRVHTFKAGFLAELSSCPMCLELGMIIAPVVPVQDSPKLASVSPIRKEPS